MLSQKHRVTRQILNILARRRPVRITDYIDLKYTRNGETRPTFAFIVSAKVARRATARNLLKRRARHCAKLLIPNMCPGAYAFFFKKGAEGMSFNDMMDRFKKLI